MPYPTKSRTPSAWLGTCRQNNRIPFARNVTNKGNKNEVISTGRNRNQKTIAAQNSRRLAFNVWHRRFIVIIWTAKRQSYTHPDRQLIPVIQASRDWE